MWLSEIEGQLISDDYGKDLTSVQNLQKKHALLEADVGAHQDRVDGVRIASEQFCEQGHFDAENIQSKQSALDARYTSLMKPMSNRKTRLMDSLDVQQLFRDVEDEEAWIREKEPIINSTNRGRDLIGVQNLIKKHQASMAEINHHEPRIDVVSRSAQGMVEQGHFASDDIKVQFCIFPQSYVLKTFIRKRLLMTTVFMSHDSSDYNFLHEACCRLLFGMLFFC